MTIILDSGCADFRNWKHRINTTLDRIFVKCPVCGKDMQIRDKEDYPFKIRRHGKPTLFFCKESHKRQYLAEHPELTKNTRGGWTPERLEAAKTARAERAEEYLRLMAAGMSQREIAKRFGKSEATISSTIWVYRNEQEEAVAL